MSRIGYVPLFTECIQQRLGLLQIGRVEPLGEPIMDRRKEIAGFGALALVTPKPGKAYRGAQLPQSGVLISGDLDRLAEGPFSVFDQANEPQCVASRTVQVGCRPVIMVRVGQA